MRRLTVVLLVAAAVAGCKKAEPPAAAQGGNPAAAADPSQMSTVKGKILERNDAPPYSYLKLQSDKGEVWAAVPQATIAVGTDVTVVNAVPMQGFESKTLKRKFDTIWFGNLEGSAPAAAAGAMPGMPPPGGEPSPEMMKEAHAKAAAGPADVGDVKVDKATGGDARTVAEVHAQRTALKEKTVTIRAKVVKFNAQIMGKNWIHLRDGSGKAEKGDNDITVTTADMASVGDVVTVKGVVRTDKDFGAGYAYSVIVEDAKVSK